MAYTVDPSRIITDRGPSIGTYRDRDIPEWMDQGGTRYFYDRPALQDSDGTVPLAQLRPDEFVVAPGVIYRRVG